MTTATADNNTKPGWRNREWNINFMKHRKFLALVSVVAVAASIAAIVMKGFNFGLDFTGGTLIEVGYHQPANLDTIRTQLEQAGFKNISVVNFGTQTDVLVRLQQDNDPHLGDKVLETLRQGGTEVDKHRIDYIGPQVGGELRDQGGIAMLVSLLVMVVYVAIRFQFKFSVGAIIATLHDVIITLGCFSLFRWTFDLNALAAVLTVLGYSLNDTIVIGDRIRENFRKVRRGEAYDIINASLNQTLGRTTITSGVTLLSVLGLYFFGGELMHGFSMALIVGIVVGTYSSIYVAANTLLFMNLTKEDMVVPEREGVARVDDGMP